MITNPGVCVRQWSGRTGIVITRSKVLILLRQISRRFQGLFSFARPLFLCRRSPVAIILSCSFVREVRSEGVRSSTAEVFAVVMFRKHWL